MIGWTKIKNKKDFLEVIGFTDSDAVLREPYSYPCWLFEYYDGQEVKQILILEKELLEEMEKRIRKDIEMSSEPTIYEQLSSLERENSRLENQNQLLHRLLDNYQRANFCQRLFFLLTRVIPPKQERE